MKKAIIITSSLIVGFMFINCKKIAAFLPALAMPFNKNVVATRPSNMENPKATQSFYDFKMKALDGKTTIDFSQYKGKKVVLLNVASKCGYTPQYADWQAFYEKNKDKVVVLGFPANEFGGQEPGSNEDIGAFCQKNYGVSFQMFEKIVVKGDDRHALYKWLSSKDLNGWNDKQPTWNFCKYLVNEKGELVNFFASSVKPNSPDFLAALEK